ncbi:MAG: metallophosphoesterase [Verrucomicrobia bacterium]|nr:metallophosphoesterase [Verrucomicrobiota bacterium]
MNTKWMLGIVAWAAMSLLSASTLGADWSFAMLGDTRGERSSTTNGVSTYLRTIAEKIASLNPELVLVGGDLINGNDTNTSSQVSFAQQYASWKHAMSPVFDYTSNTGIPIYPVRGNHDNETGELAPIPELKQAYYDAFSAYVPFNGPNYGATNDQRGFTWSFTHNNVTIVGADQYFYYNLTPEQDGYHELDRAWVAQQFQLANSAYEVFMAHVPIFMTQGQHTPEHFFGDNAAGFTTRSNFWNALGTNGVQLYVTGHLHNETVARTTNDYGNSIIQLLAGNGGAPVDPVIVDLDPGVELLYTNALYGFSLATVKADEMTIEYYSLHTGDNSWTKDSYVTHISPNQTVPEASSVVLLAPAMAALMAGRFRKRRRNRPSVRVPRIT